MRIIAGIVGHCPKCGAPIYRPLNWMGISPPPVTHTCMCYPQAQVVKTVTTTTDYIRKRYPDVGPVTITSTKPDKYFDYKKLNLEV